MRGQDVYDQNYVRWGSFGLWRNYISIRLKELWGTAFRTSKQDLKAGQPVPAENKIEGHNILGYHDGANDDKSLGCYVESTDKVTITTLTIGQ